jgi:hypothetical protein
MRVSALGFFLGFAALGFIATSLFRGRISLAEVFTDRHGKVWRVPSVTFLTKAIDFCIERCPRFTSSFRIHDGSFDLQSPDYRSSSQLYVIIFGAAGLLFLVVVVIFLIIRYGCGKCGGKTLPRRGYAVDSITGLRFALIILSFLLEGVLIYGYFTNSDFHSALTALLNTFEQIPPKLSSDIDLLIADLPDETGSEVYRLYRERLKQDLAFSVRYAASQSNSMSHIVGNCESLRMGLLLMTLILATIGCSIGVAAGTLSKGVPVLVMIVVTTIATTINFFSAGAHFAGSKIIYEYCDEIDLYLDTNNEDPLPKRLQFFVPCVDSPVFPFIQDWFVVNAVESTDGVNSLFKQTNMWTDPTSLLSISPAFWFNISLDWYKSEIELTDNATLKAALSEQYNTAIAAVDRFQLLDQHRKCAYSKNEMRQEKFLFCTYSRHSLDMSTATQVAGAVLLIIIVVTGIPAIRKFEWAGNANLVGVANGGQRVNTAGPRAKRKA